MKHPFKAHDWSVQQIQGDQSHAERHLDRFNPCYGIMHFRSLIRDLPKNLGRRTSFGEIPCSLNGSSESVDSLASVMKLDRKRGDASSRKALSLVPPQPKMTYIRYSTSFLPISFSSLHSPPPRSQYDRNSQSSFRKSTNVPR